MKVVERTINKGSIVEEILFAGSLEQCMGLLKAFHDKFRKSVNCTTGAIFNDHFAYYANDGINGIFRVVND